MHLILGTRSKAITNLLIKKLIPNGINIISLKDLDKIYESINEENRFCLIEESMFGSESIGKFILETKNDKSKKFCRIVLLTSDPDLANIKTLVKKGIDYFIQRFHSDEEIVDKFLAYLISVSDQHLCRKFIRVKPEKVDNTLVRFGIAQSDKDIMGHITDISMGGIAVIMNEEYINRLKENRVYSNVDVVLGKKKYGKTKSSSFGVDLKLVKKGQGILAFKFMELTEPHIDILADFIYDETQKLAAGKKDIVMSPFLYFSDEKS